MHAHRTLRMSAVALAAAALALGPVATGAADAKPSKPGAPTVTASFTEPAIGTYAVSVHWTAVANATSYRTAITRSGTTLKSATIKGSTTWDTKVSASPGQQLTVSVKAVIKHQPGKAGTAILNLDDEIAPTGTYHSTFVTDAGTATIHEDSLVDDSPTSQITRTVDWGDGHTESWPTGQTTLDHTYDLVANRYVPTVTLKDVAGHQTVEDSTGVVVADDTAPTGTYVVGTTTAWAKWTKVALTQTYIHDNWTPDPTITRVVDWGDGTSTTWTSGLTTKHVYATAGDYTPQVTLTDEAGNTTVPPIAASSDVVVTADTVKPTLRLILPKARHSVRAQKVLRGKATDAQTGVRSVWLKAVEKRGTTWFGYNAKTHVWVKATSKAKAFGKAVAFTLTTHARHRWAARLAGLRRGTLVYKVRATDNVGNRSATLTHKATLTKP